tara:strand:- start:398 stop:658 length:261 start_codon:yes stop_codon:yes gene_type:complete
MTNEQLIKDLNDRIDNQLICRKEVMGTVQRIVERIHMDAHQDFGIWQGRCDMDDLEALLSHARRVAKMDTMIHVLKSVEITIKESL